MGGFSAWQGTLHTALLQVLSHSGSVRKHFRVFLAWSASGASPHWTPALMVWGTESQNDSRQSIKTGHILKTDTGLQTRIQNVLLIFGLDSRSAVAHDVMARHI